MIRSCMDLLIGLDLSGVNPTKVNIFTSFTFRTLFCHHIFLIHCIHFHSTYHFFNFSQFHLHFHCLTPLSLSHPQVPITFKASQMVVVDTIKFDSSFSGNQKLVLAFDNVQSVAFRGLHVDEALEVGSKVFLHYPHDGKEYPFLKTKIEISQISVVNVKSLVLESSTFSHLPPGSVRVDRTGKVAIHSFFQIFQILKSFQHW